MPPFECLIGQRFTRWLVLTFAYTRGKSGYWLCRCTCGTEKPVLAIHLKSGKTRSCGCLRKELLIKKNFKHGLTDNPLHTVWCGMRSRCYNSKNIHYKDYGGRGIIVCSEWFNNPVVFIEWAVNKGYRKGLTLDRINNNGNYEPGNCRWTTAKEQARNTRRNHLVQVQDKQMCLSEATEKYSQIGYGTVKSRVLHGWDIERALNEQVLKMGISTK